MEEEENIKDKNLYELVPNEVIRNYKDELNIDLNYEELLVQFVEKYKITYEDLKGRPRNRGISKLKEKFIKEVITYGSKSQRELADELKLSEKTISRIVNKV